MLFSAVSLLCVAGVSQQQAVLEDPAWSRISRSVAVIPHGVAVLLDSQGHFFAHRSMLSDSNTVATLPDGSTVNLSIVAVDEQTQFALLRADNWTAGAFRPVSIATKPAAGARLIAATATGPVRGQLVNDQKVGQIKSTLRYTPLAEIRLESNLGKIGGAAVFDESGRLVGILGATLAGDQSKKEAARAGGSGGANTLEAADTAPAFASKTASNYGPQGLTVAYSLGPVVIKRVIDGLLSPDHKVKHPSVGLFFKNSTEPGALIETVMSDSPAAVAGIEVGDLVTSVDGTAIKSPVDLAMKLFSLSVGDRITVTLIRNGVERTVTVVVGSQELLG